MTLDKKLFKEEFDKTFKRNFVENNSKYILMDSSCISEEMKELILYGFEKKIISQVGYNEKEKLLGGMFTADLYQLTERGKEYFGIKIKI